jgi:hypothetical protein
MTTRRSCPPAPGVLEAYAARFDPLLSSLAQRRGFLGYLQGLLLPRDRNKTLTGLAGAEPTAGAQHREVQRLQAESASAPNARQSVPRNSQGPATFVERLASHLLEPTPLPPSEVPTAAPTRLRPFADRDRGEENTLEYTVARGPGLTPPPAS